MTVCILGRRNKGAVAVYVSIGKLEKRETGRKVGYWGMAKHAQPFSGDSCTPADILTFELEYSLII